MSSFDDFVFRTGMVEGFQDVGGGELIPFQLSGVFESTLLAQNPNRTWTFRETPWEERLRQAIEARSFRGRLRRARGAIRMSETYWRATTAVKSSGAVTRAETTTDDLRPTSPRPLLAHLPDMVPCPRTSRLPLWTPYRSRRDERHLRRRPHL